MSPIELLIPSWPKLATPVLLAGFALATLWFRSGSSHVAWGRLWTLVNGKGPKNRSDLQKAIDARSSLMEFRVRTGVKARTVASALEIVKWCDMHGEEIGDVGSCRHYFDVDAVKLKKPPSLYKLVLLYAALLGAASVILWLIALMITPRLWTSVPDSNKTWVTLGLHDVVLTGSQQRFTLDDCVTTTAADTAHKFGIPKPDFDTLCGWLRDPKYTNNFTQQVHEQRVASFSLALGLLILTYPFFFLFAGGIATSAMTKRIAARPVLPNES